MSPSATDRPARGQGEAAPSGLLTTLEDRFGARRSGDLPWENGDAYLLGEMGRITIVVVLFLLVLYLLSPFSILGTGVYLHVGKDLEGTVVYAVIAVVAAVLTLLLGSLFVQSQRWIGRSMILQSDVPAKEMGRLMADGIRDLGLKTHAELLEHRGLLVGASYAVRSDYPPVKVVGSKLGFVTWGGARSLLVVPISLFRHPKWGQEVDHLVRHILGWEVPQEVRTPQTHP